MKLTSITILLLLASIFTIAGVSNLKVAHPQDEVVLHKDVSLQGSMTTTTPKENESVKPAVISANPLSAYPMINTSHHGPANSDRFPDLAKVATITIRNSGQWSEIFREQKPGPDDLLLIPKGISVVYDASSTIAVGAVIVEGELHFSPTSSTKMTVGTLMVYPEGTLIVQPDNNKVTSEIVFSGTVDTKKDPTQVLHGLLSLGGTVTVIGSPVETAFTKMRTDSAQLPGSTKPDPANWQYHGTSARTLSFPMTRSEALEHAGYSANTVRNVIIRSAGTKNKERGHILLTGETRATVKNAALIGLGRTTVNPTDDTSFSDAGELLHVGTNQRGRYALHAHHLKIPFVFDGNIVDTSPKWGIVNHVSFGSITDNVVISAAGAGIVGEDGIESGLVSHNLVIGTGGGSGLPDDERFGSSKGKDVGHGGFGYWFRGPFLEVSDNSAIGYFPEDGFALFVHPGFARTTMPKIQGMPQDLYGKSAPDLIARSPFRLFEGNTATGYFGNAGFSLFYSLVPQTIEGFELTILGTSSGRGIFLRHSEMLTVKNSTLLGSDQGIALESSPTIGLVNTPETIIQGFK